MFFIVNKTKSIIFISDIEVTLGPRQAVDLDKLMDRSKSESSHMLKVASKKGNIDIRIKDGGKPSNIDSISNVDNNLVDFKKEMIEEIRGLLSQQPISRGVDKKDLAELAQQIIQNMPQSGNVFNYRGQEKIDEDVEMDEEKMSDIHSRAINKMVEGTSNKQVNCKEERQENTMLDNISELEGLIG